MLNPRGKKSYPSRVSWLPFTRRPRLLLAEAGSAGARWTPTTQLRSNATATSTTPVRRVTGAVRCRVAMASYFPMSSHAPGGHILRTFDSEL